MVQVRSRGGMRLLGYVALAGCGATVGVSLHAQQPPASLATFLQQRIGLDSARIASIEHGDVIVKMLDTENKRDVAVFGIIKIGRASCRERVEISVVGG